MRKISILARAAAAIFCAIAIVVAPFAQAKSAQEIFAAVAAGVVVVFALDETGEQIGQGSGVVVGENEVVTNCHVVADADAVAVRQAADSRGRRTYLMDARMAARDEERDLCLLFVIELSKPPAAIPAAAGRARDLSIGEEVFAVGAPRGLDLSLTRGIVSQLRGDFGKKSAPVIQTDAAISPGSSGGGLFNEDGKLVGITTFKHSGEGSEGLSFAMPAEWVAELQAQPAKEIANEQKQQKCLSSPTVDCLFEIALRTAKKIEYVNDRASALGDIATAFAEAGHSVNAKNTFANALRTAQKIKDARDRPFALLKIVSAQTKVDLFPDALRTAQKIEDADYRTFALNDIAVTQAKAGFFPNALRTAQKIEDADYHTFTLRRIAVEFAKAGHSVSAKNTFANALRAAEKIEDDLRRYIALRKISAAQAETGYGVVAKNTFANDLRTAEKIEDESRRNLALNNIVLEQAYAGLFPNALQAAKKIAAPYRASVLGDIATAFAETGHSVDAKNTFANALRIVEKIEDDLRRYIALRDISAAQANAGFFPNALRTAEKIEDSFSRSPLLHDIAVAQANASFFPNALRTAEKIEYSVDRDSALRGIAAAQAEAGDIKNAIETSAKIDNEKDFAVALARIAAALAKTR